MTAAFIDPKLLASLGDLPFLARTIVDGFLLGAHVNPRPGSGLEFSQYRGYEPGDDPRRLDWKLFARSDRYFVREAETESSVRLRFVLDASRSMNHQDTNGLIKFNYARYLIAALAYLGYRQGDGLGLLCLGEQPDMLSVAHGRRHYHRFLEHLEHVQADGRWPQWSAQETLLASLRYRELIVIVTDLHEHQDEMRQTIQHLRGMNHEVIVFQLIARNELQPTQRGPVIFEDLETGERFKTAPERILNQLSANVRARIESWRETLHDVEAHHEPLYLDQPLDGALRAFLERRGRA